MFWLDSVLVIEFNFVLSVGDILIKQTLSIDSIFLLYKHAYIVLKIFF